ncbi:Ig-like domain-containing protein [uncultured Treponema sp.]|uniref:pectate lyase family protein n=1 Tax=uncultured Treponema sp. TaxID=162155 RepID=UPI0025E1D43B|nr:Ig-like domain-containing protein [uncultured Treponema sp.]
MKALVKRILQVGLGFIIPMFILAACSSDAGNDSGGASGTTGRVTSVILDRESANILVGNTLKLNATVNASSGLATTVTWSSSDKNVATVADGTVTAVAAGNAIITATSTADSSKSASCSVVVEAGSGVGGVVYPAGITLSQSSLSLDAGGDSSTKTVTLTATITNANEVTSGYETINWTSSNPNVATVSSEGLVTAIKAGSTTITAAANYGTASAVCNVIVTGKFLGISASDTPTGWASYTGTTYFDKSTANTPPDASKGASGGYGASSSKIYTVSTRSALLSALSGTDKKIIYIDGMIDMTDGLLPAKANTSSTALDSWIKSQASSLTNSSSYGDVSSKVTSLATWKTWYASGVKSTADESGVYKTARSKLSGNYGSIIKLNIQSNTTIIGLTDNSGIKGGCIKISGASNVVIRNLFIQDSFDPFPQIEKGDGFNANWDGIEISNASKYIWIDHCTIQDTIATTDDDFDHIKLSDGVELKYQVFDGLCDIKQASDFVTVSYCKFANHDKTSLIGHSSSYTDDLNHQTITLHHNYYYNCKQRLPMVRFATIHIYNNFYETSGGRGNSYCIGLREKNRVYAENNYFGSGVTPTSNSQGDYYFTGNYGYSNAGSAAWTPSEWYSYEADTASNAKTDVTDNAGAGVWAVVK